jgi:hypothetical protein
MIYFYHLIYRQLTTSWSWLLDTFADSNKHGNQMIFRKINEFSNLIQVR